ncbi:MULTISPECIES: hypothetical protein [unclassified Haladaptatus]|uniref:hypothetical protein n=1 Tax=unclassified Haladaptatus TaxID=2622732 RepID=UPI0023E855C2|nr:MULTISPECIES: hypothetical protein [unclassified Haladaptatus]
MANFTLFEVHLHGEDGNFDIKPSFSKTSGKKGSKSTADESSESKKGGRLSRLRRSDKDSESNIDKIDTESETEIEIEDGDDESGRAKPVGGKGVLLALLFLVGAAMVVKKLKGGESEVDLE